MTLPQTGPSSLRPTSFAATILIFTIPLGLSCVIAVVLRTWQRIRDRNFHVDDAVTWLALLFNLLQCGMVGWGTTVGLGHPDSMMTQPMDLNASKAFYWLEVAYALAMCFSKISICSTLLRVIKGTSRRKTTWAIWLVMIAVIATTSGYFLYTLIRCDSQRRVCRDSSEAPFIIYLVWTIVYILVDIAVAVVPAFIIRGLKIKKSLKLQVWLVLAMGSVACLASILRIPIRLDEVDTAEMGVRMGSVVLWGQIETALSIIGCCLPMIRKLITSFDTDTDIDRTSTTPCSPRFYQPESSTNMGTSSSNNNLRLPHNSCLLPDQEKGLNTVHSSSFGGTSLLVQHDFSSSTCVGLGLGGRVQRD